MGDAPARVGASPAATAALDGFFDTFYRQRPVSATFTGLHAHDGLLPDWSPEGLARAADEMRGLRRVLDAAGRVPDDQVRAFPTEVDLALADGALEIALAEHESQHFVHANPSLWTGEAIFGVLSLLTRDFGAAGASGGVRAAAAAGDSRVPGRDAAGAHRRAARLEGPGQARVSGGGAAAVAGPAGLAACGAA